MTNEEIDKTEDHYDSIWKNHPMPKHYTCYCGLYVHPNMRNPKAIHMTDCPYAEPTGESK